MADLKTVTTAVNVVEKKISVKEFREMDFTGGDFCVYEVIDGQFFTRPTPSPRHQLVVSNLLYGLNWHFEENPLGTFFQAPIDVIFDDANYVQPDILFILKDRMSIVDWQDAILGVPDIVIEVLSKGSVRTDRVVKKNLYERFGVKEYWIVDPNNKAVEIFELKENRYELVNYIEKEGKITSSIVPTFDFEVQTLFNY